LSSAAAAGADWVEATSTPLLLKPVFPDAPSEVGAGVVAAVVVVVVEKAVVPPFLAREISQSHLRSHMLNVSTAPPASIPASSDFLLLL
tara:strand:+ start:717 stop:983 length:267 start_codon:yes stop_codon:yes gene_type:complete